MKHTLSPARKYSLPIGIALMFLLTWPLEAVNSGLIDIEIPGGLLLFLGWGVSLAALIVTGLTLGRRGVSALLKPLVAWRVGGKWVLVAFLLEPLLILGGVYAASAWTGRPPDFRSVVAYRLFGRDAVLWPMVLPFFLVDLVTNGEEIGWRGFVQTRLQSKFKPLPAAWIVGAVWAFWHLLKFIPAWNPWSYTWLVVHIMAFSVLLAWVYNGTQGSLLAVSVMHAASNTAGVFLPISSMVSAGNLAAYACFVVLETAAAFLVVLSAGPGRAPVAESVGFTSPSVSQGEKS